ncbi:hypothetical protein V6N13_139136 [Hibiscus sabdariffa]
MTADSSSARDGLKSPQFRRKNFSQVVRAASESTPAVHHSTSSPLLTTSPPFISQPEQTNFSDCSPSKEPSLSSFRSDISLATDSDSGSNSYSNAAALSKKQAWNVPSNDVGEVDRVMEGAAWPALSESARASTKSLAESFSKTVPDGSPSTSQAPVISQSTQSTQMKGTGYASSNATTIRPMSGQQRSSKRVGGEGNSSGSGFPHQHPPPPPPPPLPPFPVVNMPVYGYGNFIPTMDPSMGDPQYRGNNWEPRPVGGFASQLHNNPRPSRRGGSYGQRGDGGYHNNFRGRHDQDRGSYVNTRDGHMHPQRAPPRGFPRPPPPNADAFMPPQPVMSFVNPIGYPDMIYYPTMPPMEPFRGMPLFAPVPHSPMLMPVQEPSLSTLLLHQIDYYFSDANLVKDEFLKSNMDDQGWVSISLIAGFPRVKSLTDNIQLILDSLQSSTVVEVLDNRVRRCNDWINWIPSLVSKNFGSPTPGGSSSDKLASSFQQITVTEESSDQSEAGNVNSFADNTAGGHASELTGCTQLSSGEGSKDKCQYYRWTVETGQRGFQKVQQNENEKKCE